MLTSPRHANNDSGPYMLARALLIAAALVTLHAAPARAQAVTGLGEDATLAPAASLRLTVGSDWGYYDQRFRMAGASGGTGSLEPLGSRFTLSSLGAPQLPILQPLQDSLRALSGNSALAVSLGSTSTRITDRVTRIPIRLEAGLSRWLSVGVLVPIEHTSSTVFFKANPTGTEGNLGLNPALSNAAAFATDTAFSQQLLRSATAVSAYCGGSGAGTGQCSGSAALVSAATAFARSAARSYGSASLVPTRASGLQAGIDVRARSYRDALNAFAAVAMSGVPAVSAAGVVAAPTLLTAPQIQELLTDGAAGVQLAPLETIVRTHVGDVEATAKVKLLDTFGGRAGDRFAPAGTNLRITVGAGYRFATGQGASADNLVEIPTGSGAAAIVLSGYADAGLGRHFWISAALHRTQERPADVEIRTAAAAVVFPLVSDRMTVQRQLGNLTQVEATPRWNFNDFISVGALYSYAHRSADTYSLSSAATSADPLTEQGAPLIGIGSEFTAQRIGGGVAFSNARAVQMGRSRFPLDVSYLHSETVSGSNFPKLILDQIQVRLYRPLHW